MENETITPQPDALEPVTGPAAPAAPLVDEAALQAPAPAESAPAEPPLEIPPAIDTVAILENLAHRERELASRERQFQARQHALALGLGPDILAHFDYSSDEAFHNSLQIATLAMRSAAGLAPAGVPAASRPPAPAFATYLERARLFQEDPVAYQQMVNEAK